MQVTNTSIGLSVAGGGGGDVQGPVPPVATLSFLLP
jgi:hypothetical protein